MNPHLRIIQRNTQRKYRKLHSSHKNRVRITFSCCCWAPAVHQLESKKASIVLFLYSFLRPIPASCVHRRTEPRTGHLIPLFLDKCHCSVSNCNSTHFFATINPNLPLGIRTHVPVACTDTVHNSYHQSIFMSALRSGKFDMFRMMMMMMMMTTMALPHDWVRK
jgi:hypothetical protein